MPICNLKKAAALSVFAAAAFTLSAQSAGTSMKMPEMPKISTDISMPSISAPVLGTKYYTPGNVYTGKNSSAKKSEASVETSSKDVKEASSTAALDSSVSAKNLNALLGSASSLMNSSNVTAMDLTNLNSLGLVDSIYGLSGASAANTAAYSSNADTAVMLKSIMQQLEEIKKAQAETHITAGIKNSREKPAAAAEKSVANAKILRFVINGYNVLDTCRTVFFSKKETDGSFLLTGDRKYMSNNTSRDETFYLLFKADGNCGTLTGFNVEPQVVQDYKNELSFLYQLAQKGCLHADKTGNLVSLKVIQPDWNMDLLLDIGD